MGADKCASVAAVSAKATYCAHGSVNAKVEHTGSQRDAIVHLFTKTIAAQLNGQEFHSIPLECLLTDGSAPVATGCSDRELFASERSDFA